jgi:hypothetical protein
MLPCRWVRWHPETETVDILGVFAGMTGEEFPHRESRVAVYLELTDGEGAFQSRIVGVRSRDDQRMFSSAEHSVRFRSRFDVARVVFAIHDCPFPEPDEYSVQLWLDGEFAAERRFQVIQKSEG